MTEASLVGKERMPKPYYEDDFCTLFLGDAVALLASLPAESVQCCVTSPPYWGLRDYGTGQWTGGSPECSHSRKTSNKEGSSTLQSASLNDNHEREGWLGNACRKCGAVKIDQQLGLESTPQAYVDKMASVFREVRRVLKKDGCLWLNLGDSYARDPKKGDRSEYLGLHKNISDSGCHVASQSRSMDGLKPKDLVGIPWRVAFALQADGWWLRQDIIWSKPNPMPESVTDRCTKSHEYLFLLTKSERYFWDQEAMREPARGWNGSRFDDSRDLEIRPNTGRGPRQQTYGQHSLTDSQSGGRRLVEAVRTARANGAHHDSPFGQFRNRRSVWTIPTAPFSGAHFAVFPPALVESCILVGSRTGDIVLDCFAGSGTALAVAKRFGRHSIGIDLNPAYCAIAAERLRNTTPSLFAPSPPKPEQLALLEKI